MKFSKEFKCFNEDEIKKVAEKYGYKVDDDNMSINSIIYTAFILRDARKKTILSDEDRKKVYNAVYCGNTFGAALLAQCGKIDHEQSQIAHTKLTMANGQSKIGHEESKIANEKSVISHNKLKGGHKKIFNNPSVDDF